KWDNVLLADDFEVRSCSEHLLQRAKRNGDPEPRLLYVAITMAKRGLYGAYIEPLIKFLSRYSFDKRLPTAHPGVSARLAATPTRTPPNSTG
ncbi:hypothetical protein J8J23_21195, partial [Mycobacterium tuberculosis]|uniref:hypothetical protein n=1 Tax=Mycobacterium tuberculosis TaxID=1773 RepID=UPI001ADF43AD